MDDLYFFILRTTLNCDPARLTCRMTMVQSAFDEALIEVYNHAKFRWYKRLEFSLSIEIPMR